MVDFRSSVDALKRALVGFGRELARILRLKMAARTVQGRHRKHAIRKPVTVQNYSRAFFVAFCERICIF